MTAHAAARLVSMFMQAISYGVDAMLSCCSSLPTTLEPTKNTLLRAAREMNRRVTLVDGLMPGAFGIKQDVFKKMICDKAAEMIDQVDVILLAQGSMTYTEEILAERLKKPVLSSPRFGVAALAKALEAKGLQ